MDSMGRLHMPGFVGDTFEETGVLKERGDAERQPSRKERRKQEAIDRKTAIDAATNKLATAIGRT